MRTFLLAILLFTMPAGAGNTVIDVSFKIEVCAGDLEAVSWKLRKEQGGTATTKTITDTQQAALMEAADTSRTEFDDVAEEELGGWWTSIPQTTANPGQDAFYEKYLALLGTCPV